MQKIKIAKTLYHNDRTQKDADEIVKTLHGKGVPSEKIQGKGYGDSKPLYPPSSTPEQFILNNRIELTIIE
jgi:flagellar motor protein MotB